MTGSIINRYLSAPIGAGARDGGRRPSRAGYRDGRRPTALGSGFAGYQPASRLADAVGLLRPSQTALLGLGGLELFEPVHHARQGQVFGGEVVHVADVDERHMQAVHI